MPFMPFTTAEIWNRAESLAATFAEDSAATDAATAPLDAQGLLDGLKSARAIQQASEGTLTYVQALRVERMNNSYDTLCYLASLLGIKEIDERCEWAEQRIRQAGGWMRGWKLAAL